MKQRILAILLSLTMMFTLVPTAMAEGEKVAKVGETEYDTLAAAINAAGTGGTVKLLADITGQTVIPAEKDIVLDLNGKTMTHTGTTLYNSGKLTVRDSSDDKSGKIVSTGNVGIGVNHNSTTTIEYANIEAVEGAVITGYATGAKITIEDGIFEASDNAVIAGNGNSTDHSGAARVNANTIIINGGKFTGNIKTTGYIACGIYAPWKDIVTVNGGEFTVNNGIGIVARAGQVKVNGGTFTCTGSAEGKVGDKNFDMAAAQCLYFDATDPAYPAYNSETDYIKVTGGTFSSNVSAYVADGYIQNENGTVETLGETNAVAKVGDTYYKTLAEAVAAANNATVTLLKDVTANVTIPADETITLNLNGMTLTNVDDHTILNNGNLTITGTGRVDNISHAKGALYNKGTVVINGGTFDRSQENGMNKGESGQNSWYTIKNVGTMTINDGATVQTAGNNAARGKFSSLVSNGYFNTNDYNTNKGLDQPILTIDGGTFRGGLNTIKNDDRARLTINGGTFSNYYQAVVQNHNIAEITGGTFTAASDANTETYGIYNCGCGADIDLGTLTVSGGTFTGATYAVAEVSSQNAIVNISGGQFAGTKAAIIKSSTSNATIAISGGSFSQSVERKYLDRSLNAELKRASGETPYSYYTSMNDALAAAKPGDTVTDLNATTESKVTLTLKYNDGATADTTYNVASGTTITLPTPAHRSGYTFNGWYDGSKFYAAGASYKVSATATLNASWSYISSGSSSYDPTYSVSTPSKTENGSVTVSPKSASKGDTVTITVKPDSGYVLETLTVTDKNGDELKLTDKGNGKYTFTMPGSKVEVKATFMEDNSVLNFFYDVPNGAYFYEAVKWAVDKGITNGLSDTMFGPYESCTRAQIVTFLWRATGSPEPKTASSFTDVPANAYYAKAVAWAVENGITNGMTATMFAPDATCTRGQSVTFLYRALKGTASGSTNFTDVQSDAFYADAINWAVANNVTNGTSNTTFSPNADCTRAEIVTFLYRAYQGK